MCGKQQFGLDSNRKIVDICLYLGKVLHLSCVWNNKCCRQIFSIILQFSIKCVCVTCMSGKTWERVAIFDAIFYYISLYSISFFSPFFGLEKTGSELLLFNFSHILNNIFSPFWSRNNVTTFCERMAQDPCRSIHDAFSFTNFWAQNCLNRVLCWVI